MSCKKDAHWNSVKIYYLCVQIMDKKKEGKITESMFYKGLWDSGQTQTNIHKPAHKIVTHLTHTKIEMHSRIIGV